MKGVDLNRYVFDWDLTFATLFMNADGHIYHQYGNRDETDALSHVSMQSLAAVMRRTVKDHAALDPAKARTPKSPPFAVEDIPPMARRAREGKLQGCIHCHSVNDALNEDAVAKGTWKRETVWAWPLSSRVGMRLDRHDQSLVTEVKTGTPAAAAGLRKGDRLVSFAGRPVATEGDVQWGLEETPHAGGSVPLTYARGDAEPKKATLRLAKGWREGTPLDLAYRNSVWKIGPRPGFGGRLLTPDERQKAGIAKDAFGLRIGYLVTWGKHKSAGQAARKAGLQKGDICLSFDGKADFENERAWHAWFRLTRKTGKTVVIETLRDGKKRTVKLKVGSPD
jgi:hypothetical protein